jgi:uncharacterized protein (TIGR02302 family)
LSVRPPSPGLPIADPWGLRFVPFLLLAVALSGAWHDGPSRFQRALAPAIGAAPQDETNLQVWLTPPAYTNLPPRPLEERQETRPQDVPLGSTLLAIIQGGHGQARLSSDDRTLRFQDLDGGGQKLETRLTGGHRFVLRQGRRKLAQWDFHLVAPSSPSIAFSGPPTRDEEGRIRLDLDTLDNDGLAKAWVEVRAKDRPDEPKTTDDASAPLPAGSNAARGGLGADSPSQVLTIDLPVTGRRPSEPSPIARHLSSWQDLTGNLWAGSIVTIEPWAENIAGLRASGTAVEIRLPERQFANPLARTIIALRRHLVGAPSDRQTVANGLAGLLAQPGVFAGDRTNYLALAAAQSRLRLDRSEDGRLSVITLLWQVALSIEEGDRPAARQSVDDAARALQEALEKGAPQSEIERLTAELRAAMGRYLEALLTEARRQGLPPMPVSPDQQVMSPEDLAAMLDEMRDLSRTGSAEAAQKVLRQLQQLLDGLRIGSPSGPNGERAQQALHAMHDLGDIANEQKQLLDDTFRQEQEEANSPAPTRHGREMAQTLARRQDGLRSRLGKVMQSLAGAGLDLPSALEQAEQAMAEATSALQNSNRDRAVDAQTEALEHLSEGTRSAQQALSKSFGQGLAGPTNGAGRDPLGRPLNGSAIDTGDSVKIPTQAERQKSREVLEELRHRASQSQRPTDERNYLQRLLQKFF